MAVRFDRPHRSNPAPSGNRRTTMQVHSGSTPNSAIQLVRPDGAVAPRMWDGLHSPTTNSSLGDTAFNILTAA